MSSRLPDLAVAAALLAGCAGPQPKAAGPCDEYLYSATGGLHPIAPACSAAQMQAFLRESIVAAAREAAVRKCPDGKFEPVAGEPGTAPHHYRCTATGERVQ